MARRRGIIERIISVVKRNIWGGTGKPPSPRREGRKDRRDKVVVRMFYLGPLASRGRIVRNVDQMTDAELDFVLTASDEQLRNKARGDAYRLLKLADGTSIPLNPFWYR